MRIKQKLLPSINTAIKLSQSFILNKRYPLYTGLFITEKCNLRCVYCFPDSPNRKINDISKQDLFRLIDELYKMGTRYITLLGGEPLMRNDFGEIVDYIVGKNMMVEVGTNGYFTKKWISTLRKLYLVCHSIDGDEIGHDSNRGKGSYKKIIESIKLCQENGIPIQLRAVFNKNNRHCLEYLLDLSRQFNTSLSLAEQAIIKASDNNTAMNPHELREFWIQVRECKRQGYHIDKSYTLLDKIINYPVDMPVDKILKKGEPYSGLAKYLACNLSQGYCFIDVDGYMYPCATLFGKYGKNIFEVGLKQAWEYLEQRPCYLCRQSVQDLKSYFFSRDIKSMMVVARNFLQK